MATGAIVARILTQYSDKGSKQAQKDIKRLGGDIDKFAKRSFQAFGLAAAASAAFAAKIGTDAVKAAIEDEAAGGDDIITIAAKHAGSTAGRNDRIVAVIALLTTLALNHAVAAARPEAVEAWMAHVLECSIGLLSNEVDSWFTGVNKNVEGRQTRVVARYSGSAPAYRARCDEVAEGGYRELLLS